jgi:hypothetical protein
VCWTNNKRWIELTYYCCYSILWLWGFKLVDRLNKMFIFIQNIELHTIDFVVWSQKNFERGLWLWISLWQDCFNRKRYSLRFTLDLNHNFRKFLWIEFESNAESFLSIMCKDFSKISSAIENMLFLSKHKMFIMFMWDVVVWFWLHIEVYNTIGIDSYTTGICMI